MKRGQSVQEVATQGLTPRWWFIAAVAAIAVAAAWLLWPSEENRIRQRLESLADRLSLPAAEEGLARITRAATVRNYFTADVAIEFPAELGLAASGRDEVAALVARAPVPPGGIEVEIVSADIRLGGDSTSADARIETRVVARDTSEDASILDARMIALTLIRGENDWLISHARIMPPDESLGQSPGR